MVFGTPYGVPFVFVVHLYKSGYIFKYVLNIIESNL